MSRIGEELANITESIGGTPTGTSDAALEIKRIIKALDPEASTDGGVFENIVKIRELVQDGKGGGGFTLKSVTIKNGYTEELEIGSYIREDGKWVDSAPLAVNESVTVYYPEPAEAFYEINIYTNATLKATGADGISASGPGILVAATAEDGASITIESGEAPK